MKPEIKAKWVAALRSGEYEQGTEQLRQGHMFCCLGVLCDLHSKEVPENSWKGDSYLGAHCFLPKEVLDWAAVEDVSSVSIDGKTKSLLNHNDSGRTFLQIADAIEAQL